MGVPAESIVGSAEQVALVTIDEFIRGHGDNDRCELVEGEVVEMAPAGGEHMGISSRLSAALHGWNGEHRLGLVAGADGGYILSHEPGTVRQPDAAFICNERLPTPLPQGFVELAPDLVVEVVSPSDRQTAVMHKVGQWLDAGTKVVWVAWPDSRRIWVCRPGGDLRVLEAGDTLTSEDVLPGFALPVAAVFGG